MHVCTTCLYLIYVCIYIRFTYIIESYKYVQALYANILVAFGCSALTNNALVIN